MDREDWRAAVHGVTKSRTQLSDWSEPRQHKVCLVKAMVFPVVKYGCESWTIKKAEYQRINTFELWCWRRLLRVLWTARRSNQSILKEISPGCSLERLMLKLKLQYFGHLMRRVDSLEKTLMLGGMGAGGKGDDRGWDGWMASPSDGCDFEWTPGDGDDREAWRAEIHGVAKSQTRLSDWTELNCRHCNTNYHRFEKHFKNKMA